MTTTYTIRFYFADAGVKPGHGFVNFIKQDSVNSLNNENYFRGFWPESTLNYINQTDGNTDTLDQVVGKGQVYNELFTSQGGTFSSLGKSTYSDFREIVVTQQQYEDAQALSDSGWMSSSDTYNFFTRNCVDFMQAVYGAAGGIGEFVEELWGNDDITDGIGSVTSYANIKYASGVIGDVAEVFWDLVTFPLAGGVVILDGIFDAISSVGGSINDFFVDIFGEEKVTDTIHYFASPVDGAEAVARMNGVINGTVPVVTTDLMTGKVLSVGVMNQTATVGGTTYFLKEIVDSISSAAGSVAKFINEQVSDAVEWFTDENTGALQMDVANWLAGNLGDLIDGNITVDEAFIDLAEYIGTQRIAGFVSNQIASITGAKDVLAQAFDEAGAELAWYHADSVYIALTRMAVEFAVGSEGWDAEQYTKAGLATIGSVIAYRYGAELFKSAGLDAGGAAAAATVIIKGLLDSTDYGQSEWVMLGVQAGIAYGSGVAGSAIAAAIWGNPATYSNPATLATAVVITALIALTGGKIVSNIYQGQVFKPGEFGDPSLVLNSIYQVQNIVVNGQTVPALIAVNSQGSTVIASGTGIGYVIGGSGSDVLVGDNNVQTITGNGGADYLESKGGNDNLIGGDGNDHLNGGDGDDILQGDAGGDIILGEEGADIMLGGTGDDFMHGGSGDDVIGGGDGKDYIIAAGGADSISGDAGNDTLDGGYGDDSIAGGTGNDLVLGNLGNDAINGEDGNDTIFGDDGNDTIYGGNDADFIEGGVGNDILNGDNGNDIITGGLDADFVDGGLGDDDILGGDGDDLLLGGMDDDYIAGEDGNDVIEGGFGNDILVGSDGENTLAGDEGDDVFVISSSTNEHDNIITDSDGTDTILLSWLTQTNAENDLVLEQDGDDLKVTYDGRLLATVTGHFIAGSEIEKIELQGGKYIDLSAVTYNSTTHLGTFSVGTLSSGSVAADVTTRAQETQDNILNQQLYWNSTYLDKLSQIAYDEQLAENTTYTYYNGTEVEASFRNRSKFGGKYTVYKLATPGNINGTEYKLEYVVQDSEDQSAASAFGNDKTTLPAPYENLVNGATIIYTTVSGHNIQDIVIGGNVVSTKVAGDSTVYAAGATLWGATFANRNSSGTHYTSDVATKILGEDQLVGAYWDETIDGKSGDDVLVANDGNDTVIGGDGDDWLFGGDGNDTLNGGNNGDVLFGGDGNDTLNGNAGDDAVLGGSGDDIINSDTGNDWIDAGNGNDTANGGDGNDIIMGGDGNDSINGGIGADILHGEDGDDSIDGGDGDDIIYGGLGNDALNGGNGNDIIDGGTGGTTTVNGGDGQDRISYRTAIAGMTIDVATVLAADTLISIEAVGGTDYNDTINGSGNDDIAYGNAGNDTINGNNGNDRLYGDAGNDTIYGGNGDDVLDGGAGTDYLDPGTGTDTISYATATSWVYIDLINSWMGGAATNDIIIAFENAEASAYDDTIQGSAIGNTLWGLAGNDTIYTFDGDDTAHGGDGNDNIVGWNGNDTINGGNGNDTLSGDEGADTLYGDDGDDTMNGGNANDTLYGGNGNDSIEGAAGADELQGGAGSDVLNGGAGADIVDGGDSIYDIISYLTSTAGVNVNIATNVVSGGDAQGDTISNIERIIGSDYNDTLTGNSGDNWFWPSAGVDTVDGGGGIDTVSYSNTPPGSTVTVNLSTGVNGGYAAGDVLISIENVSGSSFNDNITGDSNANTVWGSGGNDTIHGGAGNDTLYGDNSPGAISGNDTIYGEDGDDAIYGNEGADALNGGNGTDRASYLTAIAGITLNLSTGTKTGDASGDTFTSIEEYEGTNYSDTMTGTSGADTLYGAGGSDTIDGGAGNDSIYGGDGDDWLLGGAGSDFYDGGNGLNDAVQYHFSTSAVVVNLQNVALNTGDAAGDSYVNIKVIVGSNYADTLTAYLNSSTQLWGKAGNDTIFGGNMDDQLHGEDGDDAMYGYAGNDGIYGENGNDTIDGGTGADYIDGGTGYDKVNYNASASGITINLATGTFAGGDAQGDTLINIEEISGSNYDDSIVGYLNADVISGGLGNDYVDGGGGNDTLNGNDGNDTLIGGSGSDVLNGGNGTDRASYLTAVAGITLNLSTGTKTGDASGDTFTSIEEYEGTNYSDTMTGTSGADTLYGAGGDDALVGGAGADFFDGGDGQFDAVRYESSTTSVIVNMQNAALNTGDAAGDSYVNVEVITGSNYNDTLTAWLNSYTQLWGNGGNDYLMGGNTAEDLHGGDGDDTISGGTGNDNIFGENGNDTIDGGTGADYIDGGTGYDKVNYNASASGVTINLATGTFAGGDAQGDSLVNIEEISGSNYDDSIVGYLNADVISGGLGNDYVDGGGGNDTLNGNDGNDTLIGGSGSDVLNGGNGTDRASYLTAVAGITLNLSTGTKTGDASGDTFTSIEEYEGTNYSDTMTGTSGADTLYGAGGDDALVGGAGADFFDGGDGQFDAVRYESSTTSVIVNMQNAALNTGDAAGDSYVNVEVITGSNYNDTLTAWLNSYTQLWANAGNDTLNSGNIGDDLHGGDGDDTINGGAGNDNIFGENGNDSLDGGSGADYIDGGAGTDVLSYASSLAGVTFNFNTGIGTGDAEGDILLNIEQYMGSNYADTFTGFNNQANNISGNSGDDTIIGGTLADILSGSSGNDSLTGGSGNDNLDGGDGNDILSGGTGSDTLNGGSGTDRADYSSSIAAITLNFSTNTHSGDAAGDTFTSIEEFVLSLYNDTFTGGSAVVTVSGGDGSDSLTGGSGNDTLYGGTGNDNINGGGGNDIIEGGAGADILNGGTGSDILSYMNSSAGVNVNVATNVVSGGDAAGDTISNFGIVYGSNYNDTFTIYAGHGFAGNDNIQVLYASGNGYDKTVYGDDGDDTITGSSNNDLIDGGAGADILNGGSGTDVLSYATSTVGVNLNLSTNVVSGGDAQGDTISNFESVTGSAFNDTLIGSAIANIISAGAGNDTVDAGSGNDTINGGLGQDTLTGGSNVDTFRFDTVADSTTSAIDVINDFVHGTDKISLSTSIATNFSGLSVSTSGGHTYISDIDSSFSIDLIGTLTIDNTDFIFG